MDMQAHYTRLFTDEQGESCFEEVAIRLEQALPVQGIDPLAIAPFLSAEGTFWAGGSTTWKGDALHPAPRRFIIVTVQGEYEVTTSKGDVRRFPRGSVLLVEDTTGKGHSTKIVSDEDGVGFCVALPS
jgi:hypothetical protein